MNRIMSIINSNHIQSTTISGNETFCPVIQNSPGAHKKPIRIRNIVTKAEAFDSLHIKPCECMKKLWQM
ncbi:hypothetical protein JTB14_027455 [Gonioctena quinquepunctata]|nr:hypothetical protein JTB14_027455 [Gonioctena quinquepunctata]